MLTQLLMMTSGLDLDEVELNFNYSNGSVSGIVSIDSANGTDLALEQANISYQLNDKYALPSVSMDLLLV